MFRCFKEEEKNDMLVGESEDEKPVILLLDLDLLMDRSDTGFCGLRDTRPRSVEETSLASKLSELLYGESQARKSEIKDPTWN